MLPVDLGRVYRQKLASLTAAFQDEGVRAHAFERIRALIDAVVVTPENGTLTIHLRGEFASMLELWAGPETKKASAVVTEEALQSRWLRGQDLNL